MRKILLLISSLIYLSALSQPKLTSFNPVNGPIGSTVIINGSGFSNIISDNVVFFGAVRAVVLLASSTSLTVKVPSGASYNPITVTNLSNNLTAYSDKPFHVTFPGAGPVFSSSSFDTHVDFATGVWPYDFYCNDFDGDGKPDFFVSNYTSFTFSVFQNTSTGGMLSYNSLPEFPSGSKPAEVNGGDIDGDGKADIVVSYGQANTFGVFRNTSTVNNISFATQVIFPTGLGPTGIAIRDIDGDGKPDIIINEGNSFKVSVFRNTSSVGNISFASSVSYPIDFGARAITAEDFDGDGKIDIAIGASSSNTVNIYKNASTPGNILFGGRLNLVTGVRPWGIAAGDLDGDNKPDLIVTNNGASTTSVFKNNSTSGNISFGNKIDYSTGSIFSQKVGITDLDGDGKLDVAITRAAGTEQVVSVFKNLSLPGNISLAPKVDFNLAGGPGAITIGDLDFDGLPDIAAVAIYDYAVSILRNTSVCVAVNINTQPNDSIACRGADVAFSITGSHISSYQWEVNDGTGWTNVINNAMYSGANTGTLQITGCTVLMNNYKYRCTVTNSCGIATSSPATLIVNTPSVPAVNITTGTSPICQGMPAVFTAAVVNGGTSPSYQWQKNGLNVGTNANIYSDNTLINGDLISCILTSNSDCVTSVSASSNIVQVVITTPVVPTVAISASANNICSGTPVTFTATANNQGLTPGYQWKKNGVSVGSSSAVYIDNLLNNGDVISCELSSSLNCVTSITATSNNVVMNINASITPAITISASVNNICPGTAVTFSGIPTNEGSAPVYQWKKNGVNVGTNSLVYNDNGIADNDIITCTLISNITGACLTASTAISNTLTMQLKHLPGQVDLGSDIVSCLGTPAILKAQQGYASYNWQDGTSAQTLSVLKDGKYYIDVTDACGNKSSDTANVLFKPLPSGFLQKDTAVCIIMPLVLKTVSGYRKYLWSNNEVTASISVSLPGIYWLKVTDNNNCVGTDSVIIYPKECNHGIFFPNAFTPDGNSKNDIFKPIVFSSLKYYEFKVFNRYGQMVFLSRDPMNGWNGRFKGELQNSGTFIWACTYQIAGKEKENKSGSVILIR